MRRTLTGLAIALLTPVSVLGVAVAASTPSGAATAPHYRNYVALGDSWSADVNLLKVTTEYVPVGCAQSSGDYPHQVAKALGVTSFADATCGSAVTDDMTHSQDATGNLPIFGGTNAPQFDRLTKSTDLVTVGIAGNDVGFVGMVEGCINLLPSLQLLPGLSLPAPLGGACKPKFVSHGVDTISQKIALAEPKIVAVIKGIKARSPHARIELVNYMNPIPAAGCYPYIQFNDQDIPWLRAKMNELDAMLARAADTTQVGLADTNIGMSGHDLCQLPGKTYVTAVIPLSTDPLLAIPFHPNQAGADHQAATVLNALGASTAG